MINDGLVIRSASLPFLSHLSLYTHCHIHMTTTLIFGATGAVGSQILATLMSCPLLNTHP